MERYLGLDIGDRTIGIAVSDPFFMMAQGVKTIRRTNEDEDIEDILNLIEEYNIIKIISGLPKNMNNTIGPQSEKVIAFVNKLKEKTDIEIIYQDERLTTVSAERILIEGNVSRKKRKGLIDKVAATYILQAYLDRR